MKIIQVCPRFYPDIGGIESHVYEISKRLAENNDVLVYTTDPTGKLPKKEIINGIKIHRFRSFAPNESYFFSPDLYFALKKEKCDVLHVHSFQAFPAFLAYLNRNISRKLIFTPHYHPIGGTIFRSFLRKFYDKIQKKIFNGSNGIICLTNYEKEILHSKYTIPLEKIIVIPNGIDIKKFKNLKPPKKEHSFRILYVGRLEKYKRVHWILLSLRSLIKKFPDKKIHFVIFGKGIFKNKLIEICKKLKIENYVTFKGNLSEKEKIKEFLKCDIFVMPSEYEAFSIVLLEALIYNKPVIMSETPVFKEFVKNNGLTFKNIDDLKEKLEFALKNGIKVNFDAHDYDWNLIVRNIEELYKNSKVE